MATKALKDLSIALAGGQTHEEKAAAIKEQQRKKALQSDSIYSPTGKDVFGNPVDASVPTGAPEVRRYTSGNDFALGLFDEAPKQFTEQDAQAIRDRTSAEMTAQIGAIEDVYSGLISDEQGRGEERLGRARSISARGGLTGSPRGEAQRDKVTDYNKQLVEQLHREKQIEIQGVYDKIDERAQTRIEAERAKTQGDIETYFNILEANRADARDNITALAEAGFGTDELDEQDLLELKQDAGFDSDLLFEAFYDSQKPDELKTKYETRIEGNKILAYGVNPTTGELSLLEEDIPGLEAKTGVKGKLQFAPDGTALLVPEQLDPTKPFDEQIVNLGNFAKPKDKAGGANDESIADLDREDPDFYLDVIRSSKGGKAPTQTERTALQKAFTVIDQVDLLASNIGEEQTGPIIGTIRKNNPYDTKAQTIKAQLTAIIPNLARGVFGEVGVLTDNDVRLYAQTLPNLTSTEDIRNAVLGLTLRTVLRAIENQLETSAASGLDVSGFESKYKSIRDQVDGIESSLGIGTNSGEGGTDDVKAAAADAGYDESEVDELRDEGYTDEQILEIINS